MGELALVSLRAEALLEEETEDRLGISTSRDLLRLDWSEEGVHCCLLLLTLHLLFLQKSNNDQIGVSASKGQ